MNSDITFKNFRVFDEKGETFKIRPITLLTGKNSCGKSSVVKGIELLCDSLNNPNPTTLSSDITFPLYSLSNMDLDFTKYPANMMGTFDKVLNKHSKSKSLIFEYFTKNLFCDDHIRTVMEYSSGISNNGKLVNISMYYGSCPKPFFNRNSKGVQTYFENIPYNDIFYKIWNSDEKLLMKSELFNYTLIPYQYFKIKKDLTFKLLETGISFSNIAEWGKSFLFDIKTKNEFISKCSDCCVSDKLHYRYESVLDDFKKSNYEVFADYVIDVLKRSILNAYSFQFEGNDNSKYSLEAFETIIYENGIDILPLNISYDIDNKIDITSIVHFIKNIDNASKIDPLNHLIDFTKGVFKYIINMAIKPEFINCSFMNSWPAIKRLYSFDDKDFASVLLYEYYKKYGNEQKISNQKDKKKFFAHKFIADWLTKFEIANDFDLEFDKEGLGVKVYLKKDKKEKTLLADEGSGITQLFFLLLLIVVGKEKNTILVEEPEIHFHPAFQSKLAELFVEAHNNKNLKIDFIIETHSPFLIGKLQNLIIDSNISISAQDIVIYYIERNKNTISKREIVLDKSTGNTSQNFGPGFIDEQSNLYEEKLNLLTMRRYE